MDFKKLSHEELIEYCKINKINYLTKAKKPMAKTTLSRLLSQLNLEIKDNNDNNKDINIDNEIINSDEIKYIEFNNLFTLIKSNLINDLIIEDDKGLPLISLDNKIKKIKLLPSVRITIGNNIFISINNIENDVIIKYYEGNCYYDNSLILCKFNIKYQKIFNIKYIYYYLLHKKKEINKLYSKGITNKILDLNIFDNLKIRVISLDKQEEIIKDYEKIIAINNNKKLLIKNINIEQEIYIKYLNLELYKKNKISTIDELCIFIPRSNKNKNYGDFEGLFPFFNNPRIINKYVDYPDYNNESIIIYDDNNIKNIYYSHQFSASEDCFILQNKNSEIVNLKYLYLYLLNNLDLFNIDNIKDINIPLPILEKQNQIIKDLEEYNNKKNIIIKNIEEYINETKKIKKIIFKL